MRFVSQKSWKQRSENYLNYNILKFTQFFVEDGTRRGLQGFL